MGEILEVEYKNKYKTKFDKGILELENADLEQDCGKNSRVGKCGQN